MQGANGPPLEENVLTSDIHIRRCRGNESAWCACISPSDHPLTTSLLLGSLVERMRESYPKARIVIQPEPEA